MSDSDVKDDSKSAGKKSFLKEFFSLGEVGRYFFRGRNSGQKPNVNIKIMHGINRIAIIIFLAGVLYLILKRLF